MGNIGEEQKPACPNCGAEVGGDPFCPRCGARLSSGEGASSSRILWLALGVVTIVILGYVGFAALTSGDNVPFCCGGGSEAAMPIAGGSTGADTESSPVAGASQAPEQECVDLWSVEASPKMKDALNAVSAEGNTPRALVTVYEGPVSARSPSPGFKAGTLHPGDCLVLPADGYALAYYYSDGEWLQTSLYGTKTVSNFDPLGKYLSPPLSLSNATVNVTYPDRGGGDVYLDQRTDGPDGDQSSTAPEGTAVQSLTEDGAGGSFACPDPTDGVVIDLRSNALPCPDAFQVSDEFIENHEGVVGSEGSASTGPLPSGFTCKEGLLQDSPPPQRVPVTCLGESGSVVSFSVVTVAD